jgi:hypothetical protein
MAAHSAQRADAIAIVEKATQQRERLFGAADARSKEARALLADLRAGKTHPTATAIAMADP